MINITFYFQFVHYSNAQLIDLKSFVHKNIPSSICHIVSNKIFNGLFNSTEVVGKLIYISTSLDSYINITETLESILSFNSIYNQLNLFVIRVNSLFYNPLLIINYSKLLQSVRSKYDLNVCKLHNIILNNYYSLLWGRLNSFHTKLYIQSTINQVISTLTKRMYLSSYY